jgi:S1-C subfamily serine protease
VPIRVKCPACGRLGRGPDQAVGRTVKCPACSHSHVLTADMVLPESPSRAGSADRSFDTDKDDRGRPGGLTLSVPVLVGGALGVALVSTLVAWAAVGMFRGPAKVDEPAVASDPLPKPPAPEVAPAPAPEAAPVLAGLVVPPVEAAPGDIPVYVAMQIPDVAAPTAGVTRPAAIPTEAAPGDIPVYIAMQTSSVRTPGPPDVAVAAPADVPDAVAIQPAVELPPEPAGESEVGARARAGAAASASRDEVAGKALSTAEIVEESEPSVALIKGNASSGTGFLVGPGLLATNAHVIEDEFIPDLEIRFVSADDKHNAPLKAELLYEDPERDLAFLAVKTDLKPLRVARTYAFRKGEDITVIGNPGIGDGQVLENAISRGVMSTKARIENRDFYQLGIAINPGNSGGPVFDSSGRVIGVATLKSTKQEATGFSIPIEDLQTALVKLSKQSTADANPYRSRHRLHAAVKGLGGGGALMCLIIDLRRAAAVSNNSEVKDLLGKLEPVVAEIDKENFPSLTAQAPRIKNDPLVAPSVKGKVVDMAENFARIRGAYSRRLNVDDNQLRPWKQTHRRLITELAASLKLEIPKGMMVAFDDHSPSQPTIITMGPQHLGSYSSRLRPRPLLGTPGGITRPPSLRDRMRGRNGIR